MILTISHLSFRYEGSPDAALRNLSATLTEGWTGIVGNNGAGKTTALKLLCGKLKPDEGSINPHISGVYCAQSTEEPPINLEDFACDYSATACQLRANLGIEDEWLWRYPTLSHGECKRVQIACALALEPRLLALDEPTNHLDAQTRDKVSAALLGYRGLGIIVSHDRELLDSLVHHCLFLDAGTGELVPGTYSEAKTQMDLKAKTTQIERKHAREELSRLQGESARRKAEASRAESRKSARHLDRHDLDGRTKIKLAIYTGQDGKAGLLSAQMDKKIQRAQERLTQAHVKKTYDKPLALETQRAKRSVVAHLPEGVIPLNQQKVLHHPTLFVGPDDKIGLKGANGAGKSTLLNALLAQTDQDDGLLFIPQELNAEHGRQILARIKTLPSQDRGRLLSIVARLNSPPERILSGADLSPGELRKLMLAEGLLGQPRLIAMDEPTNHLDLPSIEALQEVLAQCDCALLLVSHDRVFREALTTIEWDFIEQESSNKEDTLETQQRINLKVKLN